MPLILLISAFICFVLVTVGVSSPRRFNWLGAGLAFWVLSILWPTIANLH